jgi:hypothetical protein
MVAAPRPTLPVPPDRYDRAYMDRLVQGLRQQLQFAVTTETAVSSVMLLSPGGKVYRVGVDDSGNLTTTYVSG